MRKKNRKLKSVPMPTLRTYEERTMELLQHGCSIELIDLVHGLQPLQADLWTDRLLKFPKHLIPRLNASLIHKIEAEKKSKEVSNGLGDNS